MACESLAAMVERGQGVWLRAPGAGGAAGAMPTVEGAAMAKWLDPQARADGAGEAIACLPCGRVYGAGIVIAGDGATLARDVSLDFGRATAGHWLVGEAALRPPRPIRGRAAVIASALGNSYAHWLLDELPRLVSLGPQDPATTLIAHGAAECCRVAFALAQWSGPRHEPARRAHVMADELIVPALPGWTGQANARHLKLITEFVEPLPAPARVAAERIYISRAQARRRRVLNEAEVMAALTARGYSCVELERLTWAEQIAVFKQAKIVVAPHGAGLANLAFCRPATRVVECFGPDYVNACYWQLSGVRGLDYQAVIPAAGAEITVDPKRNQTDFAIDLPRLFDALR
jgi:capsular polysaccharide biosynthesis protein